MNKKLTSVLTILWMAMVLICLVSALKILVIGELSSASIGMSLLSLIALAYLDARSNPFLDRYALGKRFYSIYCHVYTTFILVVTLAIVIAWMSTPDVVVISIPILIAVMAIVIFARALWHHMRKKKQ